MPFIGLQLMDAYTLIIEYFCLICVQKLSSFYFYMKGSILGNAFTINDLGKL